MFSENLMSDLGTACLIEIGCISRWWARCRHVEDLINWIWVGDVSIYLNEKILSVGYKIWINGCGNSEKVQDYVSNSDIQ